MLKPVIKKFRKLIGLFREKPTIRQDDQEFEHLLLYHGLVGTSPDNQRKFKDVRADIFDAVRNGSALQLGIALKLSPLIWQDKLSTIFTEVAQNLKEEVISALLPETDNAAWPNNSDPLGHEDWRVRANAAWAIASLKLSSRLERVVQALHDTASSASPAFCHIANALAKLQTDLAANALIKHLNDPEPWFRIDASVALSQFQESHVPKSQIESRLVQSLLAVNPLSDYLAAGLIRYVDVLLWLDSNQKPTRQAGCQLLIGLIDAANQTFNIDILQPLDFSACATKLLKLLETESDVFSLRAADSVCGIWAAKNELLTNSGEHQSTAETVTKMNAFLREEQCAVHIVQVLESYSNQLSDQLSNQPSNQPSDQPPNRLTNQLPDQLENQPQTELLNAVKLAGRLRLTNANSSLLQLLKVQSPLQEDVVWALGEIADTRAAEPLIDLAQLLYKPGERTGRALSAQPVEELDPSKAKLYWRILSTLGNFSGERVINYLLSVVHDYAPDKRAQAINSLGKLVGAFSAKERSQYEEIVDDYLSDPSASVRVEALKGVAALSAVQKVDIVLKMTDSQEPSVSRQALETLISLSASHNESVAKAIKNKLIQEKDPVRKKRLERVFHPGI